MSGYATPEEAVVAEDSVPPQYVHIVAVHHSPNGQRAIVLIEYNEPPTVEPYIVLCDNTPDGWVEGQGVSGDGLSWMATDTEGNVGVEVAWGQQPTVRWEVPPWEIPKPPPNALPW